jgi:ABC-type dipeptide/oligopeptide/nickel transport system permease subunit
MRRPALAPRGWVGAVFVLVCGCIALCGPWLAPHDPVEVVGAAYQPPGGGYPLGLDFLGRDVLSRVLAGGRTAVLLAVLSALGGYAIGLPVGLASAYRRGWTDAILMRTSDVLLAFPALIFVLLLITALGSKVALVVVAVSLANAPRIARIVRAAAAEVVDLPFVEASRARGERSRWIMVRDILPNISAPLRVDLGVRVGSSLLLVAGVSFLGFGLQPPAADWGLMISENRAGIVIQPWPIVAPSVVLALLTIGINLMLDGTRVRGLEVGDAVTGGHVAPVR